MTTQEILEVRALARDFAGTALRPNAERWDAARSLDPPVVAQLAELGFFGMLIADADGGMGFDLATYAAALEELAWGEPAVALLVAQSAIAADFIARCGGDGLRERWLGAMATGEATGCLAFSEDPPGHEPTNVTTRAERAGEGWRIRGRKRWVTNGDRADLAIVLADRDRGAALFAVPRAAGFSSGQPALTMGLRAVSMVDLEFQVDALGAEHLLAEPGEQRQDTDVLGRVSAGAIAVGIAQAALDHAIGYAAEREQFGVAIRRFDGIRHKLAEMATRTVSARHMVERAAGRPDDAMAAAMAKLSAAECAMYVTTEAVQIFGGYGYMRDYPVEKLMRDAKATQIMHGPSEAQRLFIADALYA